MPSHPEHSREGPIWCHLTQNILQNGPIGGHFTQNTPEKDQSGTISARPLQRRTNRGPSQPEHSREGPIRDHLIQNILQNGPIGDQLTQYIPEKDYLTILPRTFQRRTDQRPSYPEHFREGPIRRHLSQNISEKDQSEVISPRTLQRRGFTSSLRNYQNF